jgi:hypothetical protein
MSERSAARRVTEALADATGRSDEEVRLALTGAAVVAGVFAVLRGIELLGNLGTNVLQSRKRA